MSKRSTNFQPRNPSGGLMANLALALAAYRKVALAAFVAEKELRSLATALRCGAPPDGCADEGQRRMREHMLDDARVLEDGLKAMEELGAK